MTTPTASRPSNLNVPNVLTVIRLIMVPGMFVVLLAHPHDVGWRVAATVIFLLAIATDFVDGKVARKYNLVTDFGKLADPIADKALTGAAFIGLSIIDELWWWVTIVILGRELAITLLRFAIKKYGVMAANKGGKAKTATQSVAISLLLIAPVWEPVFRWLGWVVMAVALVLTVVTGVVYFVEANRLKQRSLAAGGPVNLSR